MTTLLYQDLQDDIFKSQKISKYNSYINNYIAPNIKYKLRPYQSDALRNFMYLMDLDKNGNSNTNDYGLIVGDKKYPRFREQHELMFDMATGSGKTLLMACFVLYMFKKYHYHNFLYVISRKAVVHQTENALSKNGLFSQSLSMDGIPITIKSCSSFPVHPNKYTIYICFITIQSLQRDLIAPRENSIRKSGISLDNFDSTVILADEAHHYNAKSKVNGTGKEKSNHTWEDALNQILDSDFKNNYQFDFTATLSNEIVDKKYAPLMAYHYSLTNYQLDKYSKHIDLIAHGIGDDSKLTRRHLMLDAILMSQARKLVMEKDCGDTDFKPMILFRSNSRNASIRNEREFVNLVKGLKYQSLMTYINRKYKNTKNKDSWMFSRILKWWYRYFIDSDDEKRINTIRDIQHEFVGNEVSNIINLNSKKDFDNGDFKYLNDLRNPDNHFRVIFEVNKLNEGWNVLNLYDIVELNEIKGKKNNEEVQLIGRGARYCPFKRPNEYNMYQRMFDGSAESLKKHQFLETLFYHYVDNSNSHKHTKELASVLHKNGLLAGFDNGEHTLKAKLTKKFKESYLYKYGFLYINKLEKPDIKKHTSLASIGITNNSAIFNVSFAYNLEEVDINQYSEDVDNNQNSNIYKLYFKSLSTNLLLNIMSGIRYYRFDKLSKDLPIKSMRGFIKDYIQDTDICINLQSDNKPNPEDWYSALRIVFNRLASKIHINSNKSLGTNIFVPRPIKYFVGDYERNVQTNLTHSRNQQTIDKLPLNTKNYNNYNGKSHNSWFAFDYEIGNSLERQFVKDVGTLIPKIKKVCNNPKYICLLRNDEINGQLSLHDIKEDGNKEKHLDAYMPDFILYISNSTDEQAEYEFYLEPKGVGDVFNNGVVLGKKDKWKENLLEFIKPKNVKVSNDKNAYKKYLGNISKVMLYGVQFYHYINNSHDTNWNDVKNEIENKLK